MHDVLLREVAPPSVSLNGTYKRGAENKFKTSGVSRNHSMYRFSLSGNIYHTDSGERFSSGETCQKRLLKKLDSFKKRDDPEFQSPVLKTLKIIKEIIDVLPLSKIIEPSLMIDPDGEIALYWQTEKYYGELGADREGRIYFFLNNRKTRRNLPSKSIEGHFPEIETRILKEIRGKFSNGDGGAWA